MSFDIAGIISGVKTKTELNNLMRELDVLESSLYTNSENSFEETLNHSVNEKLSEAVHDVLQNAENNVNLETKRTLINEIKNGVKSLKIMTIEIPIQPSEEMIIKIHKWVTENTGAGKILDIIVDSNIIGGARITFEGKNVDLTLNKAWDAAWQEMRTKT
jgi:hypothetical protein